MSPRSILDSGLRVVATAVTCSPLTKSVVGAWAVEELRTLQFAQAHLALYEREPLPALQ
jgi:hypothetical protein